MLSGRSQTQKTTYCVNPLIESSEPGKTESKSVVSQRWGGGSQKGMGKVSGGYIDLFIFYNSWNNALKMGTFYLLGV